MPSIRLKRLRFTQPRFRKLGGLTIDLADRVTLIAGHNGIGKSTILALCANGSGVRDAEYQSYFNRGFVANLNDIVHLDYAKEFEEPSNDGADLPNPSLEYDIDGEMLTKRCALTRRTERREIRVVPRNDPHAPWATVDGLEVGQDAKVPLPTLYLGMTRMLPIGESNPTWVSTAVDGDMHPEDKAFIQAFINAVIGTGANADESEITTQSIKGTKKTAKHPTYPYSPKCVSLGQDSLSGFATALASFKKLKREWAEYPGGLLVVDEIDAGFHPHAQTSLVRALRNAARTLDLQILATTHSLCLIEAVHPDSNPIGAGGQHVDSVVYLSDTRHPRLADGYSLADIQNDMRLTLPPPPLPTRPKILKVYLEDAEAALILKHILTASLKRKVNRAAGVKLNAIPLSLGCGNLQGLMKHDRYFKTVLIAVDADASIKGRPANIVKLPGSVDETGKGRSPEWSLYKFIEALVEQGGRFPEALEALAQLRVTTDYLRTHFLETNVNINNRESAKKWMLAKQDLIERWGIVELWLAQQPEMVKTFEADLIAAAVKTAKLL